MGRRTQRVGAHQEKRAKEVMFIRNERVIHDVRDFDNTSSKRFKYINEAKREARRLQIKHGFGCVEVV